MYKSPVMPAAAVGWWLLAVTSSAQITEVYPPAPATTLEILETNTGTVIIKATAPMGSMSVNAVNVTVTCKEDTDTSTHRKEYGIAISLEATGQLEDRTIVDYDEMDSVLKAIDYLNKIDWSVTPLTGFNAAYATKGGFRIAAFSSRRSGAIEFSLRSGRMSKGLLITQSQLAQFRGLIDQAKRKLEEIRKN